MTDAPSFPRKADTHGDEVLARLNRADPAELDENILSLAQACATLASDQKATNPVILHVGDQTSYADYFIVSSAPSERQVAAISNHIEDELRRGGVKPVGVEGKREGNWILLDFGDFVVHTFLDEAREYYDLEGYWVDAPRVPVDEDHGNQVIAALRARAA